MISIVIPVYNEEKEIGRCLGALAKQETGEPLEIIVVDNNCTDQTVAIAKSFGAQIVRENKSGVGSARRAGVNIAKGDLIITIDADTLLPPKYAQLARDRFNSDSGLACLGGMFVFYDAPWKNLLRVALAKPTYWVVSALTRGHIGPMGNNMAFLKKTYDKTRGFNAELKFGEDMDLNKQLHAFGKIVLDFNLLVPISARRYRWNKDLFIYIMNLFYYCLAWRPWRNVLAAHQALNAKVK